MAVSSITGREMTSKSKKAKQKKAAQKAKKQIKSSSSSITTGKNFKKNTVQTTAKKQQTKSNTSKVSTKTTAKTSGTSKKSNVSTNTGREITPKVYKQNRQKARSTSGIKASEDSSWKKTTQNVSNITGREAATKKKAAQKKANEANYNKHVQTKGIKGTAFNQLQNAKSAKQTQIYMSDADAKNLTANQYNWLKQQKQLVADGKLDKRLVHAAAEMMRMGYQNQNPLGTQAPYAQQKAYSGGVSGDQELAPSETDLNQDYIYGNYKYRSDFDKYSKGPGPGSLDSMSSYDNISTLTGRTINTEKTAIGYMTDDEKKTYNYIKNKYGDERAKKYMDSIQQTINTRKGVADAEAQMKKTGASKALGAAAMAIEGGLGQNISGMKQVPGMLRGDEKAVAQSSEEIASAYYKQYGIKNKVAKTAYEGVEVLANMAPALALGALTGGTSLAGVGSTAANVMIGASAAGNAYTQEIMSGRNPEEARVYAITIGTLEGSLEKALGGFKPLGAMAKNKIFTKRIQAVSNGFAKALLETGSSMLSEGFEEGLQEALAPIASSIIYNEDYTPAKLSDIAHSALLGALTAGAVEGPMAAFTPALQRAAAESQANADEYVRTRAENQLQEDTDNTDSAVNNTDNEYWGANEMAETPAETSKKVGNLARSARNTEGTASNEQDQNAQQSTASAVQNLMGTEEETDDWDGEENTFHVASTREADTAENSAVSQTENTAEESDNSWDNNDIYLSGNTAEQNAGASVQNVQAQTAPVQTATVQNTGIDHQTAKAEVQSFATKLGKQGERAFNTFYNRGQNVTEYIAEATRAYNSGFYGKNSPVTSGKVYATLTSPQITALYEAGKMDSQTSETQLLKGRSSAVYQKNAGLAQTRHIEEMDQKTAKSVDRVLKDLGLKGIIVDEINGNSGIQGAIEKGTILISTQAEDPVAHVVGHEIMHRMQELAPKEYNDVRNYLMSLDEDLFNEAIDEIIESYSSVTNLSREEAADEVVAEHFGEIIADEELLEAFVENNRENTSLIGKFIKFFKDIINSIRTPEVKNAYEQKLEMLQKLYDASVEQVKQSKKEDVFEGVESGTLYDENGKKYSFKSMLHDINEGIMFEDLKGVISDEEIEDLKKGLQRILDFVGKTPETLMALDINEEMDKEERLYFPYKPNSDPLYKLSLDFSTMCTKRLVMQAVIARLQVMEGKAMSPERQLKVKKSLQKYQEYDSLLLLACHMCYVEAARYKTVKPTNQWLKNPAPILTKYFAKEDPEYKELVEEYKKKMKVKLGYKPDDPAKAMSSADKKEFDMAVDNLRRKYKLKPEEREQIEIARGLDKSYFLTPEGLTKLYKEYPVIYKAFVSAVRAATRSKTVEAHTPYYYGDSVHQAKTDDHPERGISDSMLEKMNAENGLRFSSWSDWQIKMALDMMTAVIELSVRGAKMHGYTKFPAFVRIFGKTGMMFNLSGVLKSEKPIYDEDGSYSLKNFDTKEGIDIEEALKVVDEFPETAGIQVIGNSDEQILAMMKVPWISFIIPYHASGLNKTLRAIAGITYWSDYTKIQEARAIEKKEVKEAEARALGKEKLKEYFEEYCHKEHPKWDQAQIDEKFTIKEGVNAYLKLLNWLEEPGFSEWMIWEKKHEDGSDYTAEELMRASSEQYVKLCHERGLSPAFERFYKADPDNYWKLIIDRKMINQKTGKLIEQKPVKPYFDYDTLLAEMAKEIDNYEITSQEVESSLVWLAENAADVGLKLSQDIKDAILDIKHTLSPTVLKIVNKEQRYSLTKKQKYESAIERLKQQNKVLKQDLRTTQREARKATGKAKKLSTQNANLVADIEALKAENKLSKGVKNKQIDIKLVDKAGKRWVKQFGGNINYSEVRGRMLNIARELSRAIYSENVADTIEDVMLMATPLAYELASDTISKAGYTDYINPFDVENYELAEEMARDLLLSLSSDSGLYNKETAADRRQQERKENRAEISRLNAELKKAQANLVSAQKASAKAYGKLKDKYDEDAAKYYSEVTELKAKLQVEKTAGEMQGKALQKMLDKATREQRYAEARADRLKATSEKRRKDRKRRELREKLERRTKRLSNLLRNPTDEKHVPEALIGLTSKVLSLINLSSSEAKGITKKTLAFQELRNYYIDNFADVVIDTSVIDNDGLLYRVEQLAEKSVMDMNEEELTDCIGLVDAMANAIKQYNTWFSSERWAGVREICDTLRADNENKKAPTKYASAIGAIQKLVKTDMMEPLTYFHMLGEAGESIFQILRESQDKFTTIVKNASDFSMEVTKDIDPKKLEKKTAKVTLGGQQVEMSIAQLMDLYALCKRPSAFEHILQGGISLAKRRKGLKIQESTVAIKNVTMEELGIAFAEIPAEAIAAVDRLQDYLSVTLSDIQNEASLEVFGIKKFNEDVYWRIKVDKRHLKDDISNFSPDVTTIRGMGHAKATKPHASQPVVIESAFDAFSGSVTDGAKYAAYLKSTVDIDRVRNFKFNDEEDDYHDIQTVKELLDNVFGANEGTGYIRKLLTDISTGINGIDAEAGLTDKLVANFKGAAIGANLRVVIQQPTTLLRALDVIGPQYFVELPVVDYIKGWKKALKYAPIAQWKDWGYFDVQTGRQIKDILFKTESNFNKIKDASMFLVGAADSISWGCLWTACENKVKSGKEYEKDSAEYYKAVADMFQDVINKTQVVDGVLQRTQVMRSSNPMVKQATAFIAEPSKQYNMMMRSLYDAKTDPNAANGAHLARTAVVLSSSLVLNAAAQSVMDAVRDDDRDDKWLAKWIREMFGFTKDDLKDMSLMEKIKAGAFSNLGSSFNPGNFLPYVKDVFSLLQGYEIKRMDFDNISKFVKAGNSLLSALQGDGDQTVISALADFVSYAAQVTGMPLYNLKREILSWTEFVANQTDNYDLQMALTKYAKTLSADGSNSDYYDLLWESMNKGGNDYKSIKKDIINGLVEAGVTKSEAEEQIVDQMKRRLKDSDYFDELYKITDKSDYLEKRKYLTSILVKSGMTSASDRYEFLQQQIKSRINDAGLYEKAYSGDKSALKEIKTKLSLAGVSSDDIQYNLRSSFTKLLKQNNVFETMATTSDSSEFSKLTKFAKAKYTQAGLSTTEANKAVVNALADAMKDKGVFDKLHNATTQKEYDKLFNSATKKILAAGYSLSDSALAKLKKNGATSEEIEAARKEAAEKWLTTKAKEGDSDFLPPDSKATYNRLIKSVTSSSIYKDLDSDQQEDIDDYARQLATGSGTSYEKLSKAVDAGVSDSSVLLFEAALETANSNGGSISQGEFADAVSSGAISSSEASLIWTAWHMSWSSKTDTENMSYSEYLSSKNYQNYLSKKSE